MTLLKRQRQDCVFKEADLMTEQAFYRCSGKAVVIRFILIVVYELYLEV